MADADLHNLRIDLAQARLERDQARSKYELLAAALGELHSLEHERASLDEKIANKKRLIGQLSSPLPPLRGIA